MPPVSSLRTRAISGRSAPKSPPAARSTNSEISSALRPPSRSPHHAFGAAQVDERRRQRLGNLGLGVAERRDHQRAASAAPRARCRKSSSVGVSAQCPSSITTTSGVRRPTADEQVARPRCADGGARCPDRPRPERSAPPTRCARSGSSRESSPPSAPSVGSQRRLVRCSARAARAPRRTAGTAGAPPSRTRRRARARRRLRPRARTRGPDGSFRIPPRRRPARICSASPSARGISVLSSRQLPSSAPRTETTASGGVDLGAWTSQAAFPQLRVVRL